MKVKKTLIFPFEQQAPYTTTSKQSLLRMAATWLETTMRALKDSKTASKPATTKSSRYKVNAFNRSRMIRNCPQRPYHHMSRTFSPACHRRRLNPYPTRHRSGNYHW